MKAVRDQRSPRELAACAEILRQHTWPWPLLCAEVFHLAENTGLTPNGIADRLDVPWPWIEQQYTKHRKPLPYSVRVRARGSAS